MEAGLINKMTLFKYSNCKSSNLKNQLTNKNKIDNSKTIYHHNNILTIKKL